MLDAQPLRPSLLERLREPWSDRRAEMVLGALASIVLILIAAMVVFVFAKAMPSFTHNGFGWFGSGPVDAQATAIFNNGADPAHWNYQFSAWSLIWGTLLTTGFAVFFGLIFSLFAAIFIVEFAPPRIAAIVKPVVRLLAAVPSVIWGLIGILVVVPFVRDHLISGKMRADVAGVIQLNGAGLLVAVVILTMMIVPIMIAINVDALTSVPRG